MGQRGRITSHGRCSYQPKYDFAVCPYLEVYPISSGLSRKIYPISGVSLLFRKYRYDDEAVSCLRLYEEFSCGAEEKKVGYIFLDILMGSGYSNTRRK